MTDCREGLLMLLISKLPRKNIAILQNLQLHCGCSGVHSAGPGRSPLRLAQEWLPRTPGPLLLRRGRRQGEDDDDDDDDSNDNKMTTRCTAATLWRLTTAPVCTPASGSAAPTPRSCPHSGSSRSGFLNCKISHFCSNIVQKERN